jgi:hypothetical protein
VSSRPPSLRQRATFLGRLARNVPANLPVPNPFARRTLEGTAEQKAFARATRGVHW